MIETMPKMLAKWMKSQELCETKNISVEPMKYPNGLVARGSRVNRSSGHSLMTLSEDPVQLPQSLLVQSRRAEDKPAFTQFGTDSNSISNQPANNAPLFNLHLSGSKKRSKSVSHADFAKHRNHCIGDLIGTRCHCSKSLPITTPVALLVFACILT